MAEREEEVGHTEIETGGSSLRGLLGSLERVGTSESLQQCEGGSQSELPEGSGRWVHRQMNSSGL